MKSSENREQQIKANQPTEKFSNSPPLSKVETLKLLNESIDKLEQTIKGISESSNNNLPSSASINDLVNTTQELANTVAFANTEPSPQPIVKQAPAKKTNLPTAEKKVESIPSSPNKTPAVKAKKQEKLGLIAIGVFAIAMATVAIFWLWLPQRQARLASLTQPEPQEIIADGNTLSVPETINTPEAEPIDIVPENSTPQPETVSKAESLTEIAIPSELTSPGRAKNLKMVTIEPELTFTPEQTLVAALQSKIAQVSEGDSTDTDTVDSIKVDLPQSSLLIKVTDNWYELNESRQNKLANEILERSRKLQFNKLELQDSTGTLVARNPVIGNQIIILKSDKNNDAADARYNFAPKPGGLGEKEFDSSLSFILHPLECTMSLE